jgi:hypothetical protein
MKQIKLRENPSAEELEKQLSVINSKFNYIISSYKSFSLKLEKCSMANKTARRPLIPNFEH